MILALKAYDLIMYIIINFIVFMITLVINIREVHNYNSETNNDTTTTNTNKLDNNTNISDDVFNAFSKHDNVR